MNIAKRFAYVFLLSLATAVGFMISGCDQEESNLEVDTSDGLVEVERDLERGDITVDVVE